MKAHAKLLCDETDIGALASTLKGHDTIAFDTEFIRESTFFPIVELIQIATDEEAWLVDARAFKKNFASGPSGGYDQAFKPLLDILQDKSILKIGHAIQGDQECLYTSFGVLASPVLDTAISASLCGYGDGVGLGTLLKMALGVAIKKGHARTNWSVRPLPPHLAEYAFADVSHLVALGRTLLNELDAVGRRSWALELSAKFENVSLYHPDTTEMAAKLASSAHLDKRTLSALISLLEWREKKVRQLDLPKRWVADDSVLVDLARVRPKDLEHLQAFRGLNKAQLAKGGGDEILTALKRASETKEQDLPEISRSRAPSAKESHVIDLLRCCMSVLAEKNRISPRYLATVSELLELVRSHLDSPEELIRSGILSPESARLIGKDCLAMLNGRLALLVDVANGAQIRLADIEEEKIHVRRHNDKHLDA